MSDPSTLYPPAPPGIPTDLAKPTRQYRLLTIVVLISLFLFVLLYLGLVGGSGWLVWWSFTYDAGHNRRGFDLLQLGAIAGSIMLFLFLLKGLFKRRITDKSRHIRLNEEDQPELFAFVRQLCRDTRAPFPKSIYLTHDVNAAVFYDTSLLSLILPVRKNLLIGLGLVNMLNLNEFKAVLAHEFGHFSQRSMKLGSYVYTANGIITDMVYGRDYWDNILRMWRSIDLRLSFPAWALAGVVWVLRKMLAGVFRLINIGNLALTRQMEFNADLVAVSVTGSDALIHALSKLDFANESLLLTLRDLQDASDHGLYTSNLFYHQTKAAEHLRQIRKDPSLGQSPTLPDDSSARTQVFEPGDTPPPSMWATHPSNHDREINAKERYFRSLTDDRSAWVLFANQEATCEEVTQSVYRLMLPPDKHITVSPPEKVQEFIDEERSETTYDPKYHGFYDGRPLNPGDIDQLINEPLAEAQTLTQRHAALYVGELEKLMERNRGRVKEFRNLLGLKFGAVPMSGRSFVFRDKSHPASDLDEVLKLVSEELEEDRSWQSALDRNVFVVHYQLARLLENGMDAELVRRYRFQRKLQEMGDSLMQKRGQVEDVLNYLSTHTELSQADLQQVIAVFREAHKALNNCLHTAEQTYLPALRNIEEGRPLDTFLLEDDLIHNVSSHANSISGQWIGDFLKQMGLIMDRLGRIQAKSLGGILALQEKIAEEWAKNNQGDEAATTVYVSPLQIPLSERET